MVKNGFFPGVTLWDTPAATELLHAAATSLPRRRHQAAGALRGAERFSDKSHIVMPLAS